MASLKQFKLPDVGEGLTEAEVVRWLVQVGDRVTQNQTIVEIETAKALVELPSPFAGVVSELLIAEGTTVEVGTPIIIIDVAPASTSSPSRGQQPRMPRMKAARRQLPRSRLPAPPTSSDTDRAPIHRCAAACVSRYRRRRAPPDHWPSGGRGRDSEGQRREFSRCGRRGR